MSRALARRLDRIEAARAPASAALGHVLRLQPGETRSEALRRLHGQSVGIPKGHGWLIVPAKVTNATRAAWEAAFGTQQRRLVAEADVELTALRRAATEAGATLVGPIAAALERHHVAAKSNPYRRK